VHDGARILVYGLFAAASPTVLLATLVVLGSKSPRRNGFAFMVAFVLGMTLAFVLALTLGHAVTSNDQHENSRAATLLELLAGLALLAIAMRTRPPHVAKEPDPESRTEHLFTRLEKVRPATVFGIGLPLGVGAKRLTITLLAAGTVSLSGFGSAGRLALGVLYIAVASVVVWLPVLVYLILGAHADDIVARSRVWITMNQQRFTFYSVTVLGVLLVGDALLRVFS
jgi:cytochrome c biogenesis protein CcdA